MNYVKRYNESIELIKKGKTNSQIMKKLKIVGKENQSIAEYQLETMRKNLKKHLNFKEIFEVVQRNAHNMQEVHMESKKGEKCEVRFVFRYNPVGVMR